MKQKEKKNCFQIAYDSEMLISVHIYDEVLNQIHIEV